MGCQPTDCLNDIFEYLEKDKFSLHSCLLVNRLWCEVAVRILWKNVWIFLFPCSKYPQQLAILGTLTICLPIKSTDLLHMNRIFIPTPTLKPPLFNYIFSN